MTGINDYGTVSGSASKGGSPGQFVGATVYSGGGTTFYSAPNSYTTVFSKRNDSGVVVGFYGDTTYAQHYAHGIVLHNSTLAVVNFPGATDTFLNGINKWGSIVGYGRTSSGTSAGFKLMNGSYQKIAYPGFSNSTQPMAISDVGVIVGTYDVYSPVAHGFVYANGKYQKLDVPFANQGTYLYDVNTSGVIVGDYISGSFAQGFIYKNGAFKIVVYPGATNTQVYGISNKGVVVGNWANQYTQGAFTAVCQ